MKATYKGLSVDFPDRWIEGEYKVTKDERTGITSHWIVADYHYLIYPESVKQINNFPEGRAVIVLFVIIIVLGLSSALYHIIDALITAI